MSGTRAPVEGAPAPAPVRRCACGGTVSVSRGGECESCRRRRLARAQPRPAAVREGAPAPPAVYDVLHSGGQALDGSTRAAAERRFGLDFGGVRVHADDRAALSARAVGAAAYTVGDHIVLGRGRHAPATGSGRRLLTHELAHVAQQRGAPPTPTLRVAPARDRHERAAERAHERGVERGAAPRSLQRTIGDGHDLTATRFAQNRTLEAVFDNERVLERGDSGTAVRLIQDSLVAMGYTLPVHGADGDYGRETETAVRAFQVHAGARVLDGKVGPETMGLLDMHDPGGTRVAPAPGGPAPPAAATAAFSEHPGEQFAGYDASVAPNWLVVPTPGRRRVRLAPAPANARPAVVSIAPAVATVSWVDDDEVIVTGIADGNTRIEAREGAAVLATLRVEVKALRDLTIDYHFMRDSAVPPHRTSRRASSAPTLTATVNRVWERQANVRFTTGTVNSPTIPGDLGGQVLWAAGPGNEWPTVTAFATGGNVNVFLVWEYEQDATPLVDDTNAGTLGSNILLEDAECGDALTVAHEVGHFLGAAHAANGVMSGCPGANRRRVTKADADIANP